jgi:hypothetical protein
MVNQMPCHPRQALLNYVDSIGNTQPEPQTFTVIDTMQRPAVIDNQKPTVPLHMQRQKNKQLGGVLTHLKHENKTYTPLSYNTAKLPDNANIDSSH